MEKTEIQQVKTIASKTIKFNYVYFGFKTK